MRVFILVRISYNLKNPETNKDKWMPNTRINSGLFYKTNIFSLFYWVAIHAFATSLFFKFLYRHPFNFYHRKSSDYERFFSIFTKEVLLPIWKDDPLSFRMKILKNFKTKTIAHWVWCRRRLHLALFLLRKVHIFYSRFTLILLFFTHSCRYSSINNGVRGEL